MIDIEGGNGDARETEVLGVLAIRYEGNTEILA